MEKFCGSALWDPQIWHHETSDFTSCFHQTVLAWVPCGLLWFLAPLQLIDLRRKSVKEIPWSVQSVLKVILTSGLTLLSVLNFTVSLLRRHEEPQVVFPVQFITPVVRVVSYLLTIYFVLGCRKKGIQSSGLLFIYWMLMLIAGVTHLRPAIRVLTTVKSQLKGKDISWKDYSTFNYFVYLTLLIGMFSLNCVSDRAPLDRSKNKRTSPEQGASFPRRIFFQWFDVFMWRGLRNPIDAETVWNLREDDLTANLTDKFNKFWNRFLEKEKWAEDFKKKGSEIYHLIMSLYHTCGYTIWTTGIAKLTTIFLALGSPQILGILIGFMSSDESIEKGIFFTVLLFLMTLAGAVLSSQISFHLYHLGLQVKGILSSAIYRKSLKISFSEKDTATTGELINYMAVDTYRCFDAMSNLHVIWEGPLVLVITMFVLYFRIGVAAFSALGVVCVCAPLNLILTKRLYANQTAQMREKDVRIKMMNEILNGIKIVKLYAWERCFQKNVEEVREREIKELKQMAKMSALTYMIWMFFPFLVTFTCFATYVLVDDDNVLDSEIVFVVMSTISFLCGTITNFNLGVNALAQVWTSLKRIAKFLASKEINVENVSNERTTLALAIKNGTFNWDGEAVVLRSLNLEVAKGSLTAVVGPVGSGKSSMISALLGEMQRQGGSVNVDGSVAYVAQQAWIQNATVQENILFGRPMNRHLYHDVVHACALKPDLEMLPCGDQTEIGEKGINLSGGQKQRIALARAVYSNADIYLLDDPLSAVDAHVGKHIFDNIIGPKGLLAGKTRLLVTHAVSFLPQVDTIYVLLDGRLREKGSYYDLINGIGEFSEFLMKHISEMMDEDQLQQIRESFNEEIHGRAVFERAISIRSTTSASSLLRRMSKIVADDAEEKTDVTLSTGNIIEKEVVEKGNVHLAIYKKYLQKVGPFVALLSMFMVFLCEASSVGSSLWLTKWSSDTNGKELKTYYLTYLALFGIGRVVAIFSSVWILSWGTLNGAKKLHNDLLSTTIRLPMSFFDTTPLGRIMNRFSKDIDIVDMYLPTSIRLGSLFFFHVVGVIVVISLSNPNFIYALLGFGVFYYFVQKLYIATSRQLKRVESMTLSPIYSHFSESLAGLATIRAFRKQGEFTDENSAKIDWNQKVTYAGVVANRWLSCRLEIMGSLIVLFTALFAVLSKAHNGDPAVVGLSITYALNSTIVLSYFVRMMADIETNIVAVERIDEYSNLQREKDQEAINLDENWPTQGLVQFEDLKLRYRPGLDSILKGISFTINPREKIGIVGRTGAGKSSLTLALFRIIEAAGGKILIDGINIAELPLNVLRRRLTIIPQDPVLFGGTIRSNLDPFDNYTDDQVWNALELSHLKFYVSSQPLGLLHMITEGGDNLSIGQRQLICLARALLRKTKVLVLDEATAAVDLETDELIQTTIRSEFADCTVLTIAHRLNTILDSDKVVVLEDGEIVEFDLPAKLLQNRSSKFYKMAEKSGISRADFVLSTKL